MTCWSRPQDFCTVNQRAEVKGIDVVRIYAGCAERGEIEEQMRAKGFPQAGYAVVRFRGEWYGVGFERYAREVMMGKEEVWYRWCNRMCCARVLDYRPPYVTQVLTYKRLCGTIAKELRGIDANIEVEATPGYVAKQQGKAWKSCFLVLLGLTFHDEYYRAEEIDELRRYFRREEWLVAYRGILRKSGADAINPFRGRLLFADGHREAYSNPSV